MKVLGLIPRGLIGDKVVTTNYEKSAEVIVGKKLKDRTMFNVVFEKRVLWTDGEQK